jgi:hypothetical protein
VIVAIHQPNFLPWLGFFNKMARCDTFVLLDSVSFCKGSYTNRVKIKTAAGSPWLTVPVVTHHKMGQLILEVRTSDTVDWRKKSITAIETHYHKCSSFARHADRIFEIVRESDDRLAELNLRLIEYVAQQLEIRTPVMRSSQMAARGAATDLLIALCKEVGADTYLSGEGGKGYLDEHAFGLAGLHLTYADFVHPTYPQLFGDFVPGLSIMDLLFNVGPDSRRILGA